jgi:hypothetical protein
MKMTNLKSGLSDVEINFSSDVEINTNVKIGGGGGDT